MTLRTLSYLLARCPQAGRIPLHYLGRPWLLAALSQIEAVLP